MENKLNKTVVATTSDRRFIGSIIGKTKCEIYSDGTFFVRESYYDEVDDLIKYRYIETKAEDLPENKEDVLEFYNKFKNSISSFNSIGK